MLLYKTTRICELMPQLAFEGAFLGAVSAAEMGPSQSVSCVTTTPSDFQIWFSVPHSEITCLNSNRAVFWLRRQWPAITYEGESEAATRDAAFRTHGTPRGPPATRVMT